VGGRDGLLGSGGPGLNRPGLGMSHGSEEGDDEGEDDGDAESASHESNPA
jgi:hypothetical protein